MSTPLVIAGLQKMTLLDYPGQVACTVFLPGCNFRCPFCHNSGLLTQAEQTMDADALIAFLEKRRGLLDAVCITGGEPTLQPGLPNLLARIKALGFKIKLDTNGSRPAVLKALVAQGLVDYVAMDVKNSPTGYAATTGLPHAALEEVEESLRFLLSDAVDYELRTTVVKEFHSPESMVEMGKWLCALSSNKPRQLFLQCFVSRDSVLLPGLNPPTAEELTSYVTLLSPYVEKTALRGV